MRSLGPAEELFGSRNNNFSYALLCGGISIFLAVVAASLIEQEYAIAVHVMNRIRSASAAA